MSNQGGQSWLVAVNSLVTTVIAVCMLLIAYAQWAATEKQAEIADALARLELAKAEPIFDLRSSKDNILIINQDDYKQLEFPSEIFLSYVEMSRGIVKINASIFLSLLDKNGKNICDMDFRGLYRESDNGTRSIFKRELIGDIRILLDKIKGNDFFLVYRDYGALIWYQNIFRESRFSRIVSGIEMDGVGGAASLVVYSGAYSLGAGFYFDDGAPARICPSIADHLAEAVRITGGHPGSL